MDKSHYSKPIIFPKIEFEAEAKELFKTADEKDMERMFQELVQEELEEDPEELMEASEELKENLEELAEFPEEPEEAPEELEEAPKKVYEDYSRGNARGI